jgi:Uma2 family endonuclease
MTAVMTAPPVIETLADLLDRLGVPPHRIRMNPPPGTATEADVLASRDGEKRLCELVHGVLVEKAMGFYEALLAGWLIRLLGRFLDQHDLGFVLPGDATLRLKPGRVRLPDVSFVSWDQFPDRKLPRQRVPPLAPDLAVEVISEGNTATEMKNKLQEYFTAGVRLVWYVYPETRTVQVYTSLADVRLLGEDDTLDGGSVLPGFRLSVREWFEEAGEREDLFRDCRISLVGSR